MRGLLVGLFAVGRGALLLLRQRELRKLAIRPMLTSLALFAALVAAAVEFAPDFVHVIGPGVWEQALAATLHWAVVVILVVLAAVTAIVASHLIAQPFIDPLSAATDRLLDAAEPTAKAKLLAALGDAVLTILDVVRDLLLLLLAEALVVLMGFIPVAGAWLSLVFGWLTAVYFAGVAMVASPLCRRGYRGRERWRAMRAMRPWVLGVGISTTLLLLVPLADLLTLPIAVIGATLAVRDAAARGRLPELIVS
jgi:CysZ protein